MRRQVGEHRPGLGTVSSDQREETLALGREQGVIVPWVFHRDGRQISDYRDSWQTACRNAGVLLPGLWL